ncbi:DUF1934 domain-containing protein [uncultured Megasphaera sp.]|uniref:DUF1934 domain-containing protein n=1 Tax=uncultured Megasphaera sp. TaxID=165188 RepID=UPI002611C246|nr:DUF1934 domain-containing protein [uncultured Megasphaera sp.]
MKPVIVKVKSVQRNEEGEELAIELVSEGKAYKKERTQYIVYEESELTDMEGVTTVIKVLPDGAVMLLRIGKVHQRQEYRKGKVSHSKYETPVGALNVTFRTYECDVQLCEGIGTIHLGYDVDLEGVGSNYTQLTITVQEDNCNGNEGIIETGHC